MVLSLAEICLRSIMDGVESGNEKIGNLHKFVPLKLRQRLLDMVLVRGKINNPIWMRELSSKEFLRGLTSFSTQNGKMMDEEYLNLVAESMGSKLENGETIGAGMKKLRLDLYCKRGSELCAFNLNGVVRLIAQCSNLTSLDIDTTIRMQPRGRATITCRGLLNRAEPLEPCRAILENLQELSLIAYAPYRFLTDNPIIGFKNLTSLRLEGCSLDNGQWRELLKSVQNTLTHLRLRFINWWFLRLLPIPLPFLKLFEVDGFFDGPLSFAEDLRRCPKLENVYLSFGSRVIRYRQQDLDNLTALSRIKAELEVKLNICEDRTNVDEILDGDSNFKLVSIFGEKISHLELCVRPWNSRYATAFEKALDACQNLKLLCFILPPLDGDNWLARQKLNWALARLFGDPERASKLRELQLNGGVDLEVFTLMSENCSNLERLTIWDSTNFGDVHLIRLAERGVKLSELCIGGCNNVSDAGFIPILVSSGERLIRISGGSEISDRAWRILIDHCRNVEQLCHLPRNLEALARSKCFNLVIY